MKKVATKNTICSKLPVTKSACTFDDDSSSDDSDDCYNLPKSDFEKYKRMDADTDSDDSSSDSDDSSSDDSLSDRDDSSSDSDDDSEDDSQVINCNSI